MTVQKKSSVLVRRAGEEEKPVAANLIQLYLHDVTGDLPFPIGRNGIFEYDFLDRFWQHPYLIFQGDELAGFAFVVDGSPVTSDPDRYFMAEFFVLKAYRRKGVGTAAFEKILRYHSGPWQIGVLDKNKRAKAFWARTVEPYKPAIFPYRFDGENWLIYEFEPISIVPVSRPRAMD